jgi:hypothetical protein
LQLVENLRAQTKHNTAAAGILDHRAVSGAAPMVAAKPTRLLVKESKLPDVTTKLNTEDLTLLLSQPVELNLAAAKLNDLRQRVGYKYVLVGEEGGYPTTRIIYWDFVIVIPAGPVIITLAIPAPISQKHGIFDATRILRVIDLENATIVGESFDLLRAEEDDDEFSGGQISDGISNMKLGKGQ